MTTAFKAALPAMRAQITAQIQGNGASCDIQRFNQTTDESGRKVGAYESIMGSATETIWIQPYSIARGGSANMQPQGVSAETTHIGYQVWGGVGLIPKDRIAVTGEAFVYDVVDQQIFDTHHELLLKKVRRV